jgi:hypothetical protein
MARSSLNERLEVLEPRAPPTRTLSKQECDTLVDACDPANNETLSPAQIEQREEQIAASIRAHFHA